MKKNNDKIEVEFSKMLTNINDSSQYIIVLEGQGKVLQIYVSEYECHQILMASIGFSPPRPTTHQVFVNTIKALGGKFEAAIITDLDERDIFISQIEILKKNEKSIFVDARPSDGIPMAMREKKPIYVEPIVFEKIGETCFDDRQWKKVVAEKNEQGKITVVILGDRDD